MGLEALRLAKCIEMDRNHHHHRRHPAGHYGEGAGAIHRERLWTDDQALVVAAEGALHVVPKEEAGVDHGE